MATELDPVVGSWYLNSDSDTTFEVVAMDEDEGTVEIQLYEGEVEEIDIDDWYEMNLEQAAEPDDWTGAYDDTDDDDDAEELEEFDEDDDDDDTDVEDDWEEDLDEAEEDIDDRELDENY
ncbi:MAG: hypothetical protein HY080_06830 [Gammaproteobacteria bacterium]|nr:hypothetical protein [Gammaproteobacteria bacterium]